MEKVFFGLIVIALLLDVVFVFVLGGAKLGLDHTPDHENTISGTGSEK